MSKSPSPFCYFHSLPELIQLVVLMYMRFPLSLRNVENLLFERGIDIRHETVRLWWNRFGPLFAADIRRQRVNAMRGFRQMKSKQKFVFDCQDRWKKRQSMIAMLKNWTAVGRTFP